MVKLLSTKDYILGLTDIVDRKGRPASIDGQPTFTSSNPDVGTIVVTSGDPRVTDGTVLFVPGTNTTDTTTISADVDRDLNPDVADHLIIVTEDVQLVEDPADVMAASAHMSFGDGIARV